MTLEANDSFIRVSLKEIEKTDPFYETLQKLVNHIQISVVNVGAAESGIAVVREDFLDAFVGTYAIREDGSGKTIGLFKNVDGILRPIRFPLPGEIALLRGGEVAELVPPAGWRIVEDEDIQRRYNIGASPNWKVAAIEYIGI